MKHLIASKFLLLFIVLFSFSLTGEQPKKLSKKENTKDTLSILREKNQLLLKKIENRIDEYDTVSETFTEEIY
jgi:hypothetical protein